MHAYNSTAHDTTGYMPFFLMFGRHAHLPTDVMLGVPEIEVKGNQSEWVKFHHAKLLGAYQKARKRSGLAADRSKGLC